MGWIFGIRDVLFGDFTAVDKNGKLIVQSIPGWNTEELGTTTAIERAVEAFRLVGGHHLSDVATPAGLPAPFMSLLLFVHSGSIKGYSVGDIARQMYRSGYDFRHFLAGSIPVALIELVVRLFFMIRSLHDGATLIEAFPAAGNPRLRSQLFWAHSAATAVNLGKVAVTQSPLSVSWGQWMAFFRYLLPQVYWLVIGKEEGRQRFVGENIGREWDLIDETMGSTWQRTFNCSRAEI